jgi:hypothetical protein
MKKFSVALIALATVSAIAPASYADTIAFNVTGTGTQTTNTASVSFQVSGTQQTTGPYAGDYLITGLTGGTATINGQTFGIVSLITPSTLASNGSGTPLLTGYMWGPTDPNVATSVGTTSGPGDFDNEIITVAGSPVTYTLDNQGLAFLLSNGEDLQIFVAFNKATKINDVVITEDAIDGSASTYVSAATNLNITQSPEPGSLVLFGTGLIGFAGLLRRKYMVSR